MHRAPKPLASGWPYNGMLWKQHATSCSSCSGSGAEVTLSSSKALPNQLLSG